MACKLKALFVLDHRRNQNVSYVNTYNISTSVWRLGLKTSRSQEFCQFFSSLSIGIRKFGLEKKVSVSVSENLVSEKSLSNGIDKFGLIRKVSVSVSENLVSEKSLGIVLRKFGLGKKLQRNNGQK